MFDLWPLLCRKSPLCLNAVPSFISLCHHKEGCPLIYSIILKLYNLATKSIINMTFEIKCNDFCLPLCP